MSVAASRLIALGWNDDRPGAATVPAQASASVELGRLIRVERGWDTVALADRDVQTARAHAAFRSAQLSPPAVGDWVLIDSTEGGPAIVATLPRRGVISRRDPSERVTEQVVAANVDRALLVFPSDRPLRPGRLERWLVICAEGGVPATIVLSKTDVGEYLTEAVAVVGALAPHHPVVRTTTAAADGVASLIEHLGDGGTSVLLGESGGGKSTLVNTLVGQAVQRVAEVRQRDGKGRHTTVSRQLVMLPFGGVVVDTPGLRSLALWTSEDQLGLAFPEIDELARNCRFADCAHGGEPGCEVGAAVATGSLDRGRLERYRRLAAEGVATEERKVEQERAARRGRGRARHG